METASAPGIVPGIVIDTLARHLAEGYALHATCVPCWRHAELDLAALVAAGKGGLTLDALRPRLRCRVCGGGTVQLTRLPPTPRRVGYC